jgi:hypothetical protein
MALERGFRRLTLVLSIVVLGLGVAFDAFIVLEPHATVLVTLEDGRKVALERHGPRDYLSESGVSNAGTARPEGASAHGEGRPPLSRRGYVDEHYGCGYSPWSFLLVVGRFDRDEGCGRAGRVPLDRLLHGAGGSPAGSPAPDAQQVKE